MTNPTLETLASLTKPQRKALSVALRFWAQSTDHPNAIPGRCRVKILARADVLGSDRSPSFTDLALVVAFAPIAYDLILDGGTQNTLARAYGKLGIPQVYTEEARALAGETIRDLLDPAPVPTSVPSRKVTEAELATLARFPVIPAPPALPRAGSEWVLVVDHGSQPFQEPFQVMVSGLGGVGCQGRPGAALLTMVGVWTWTADQWRAFVAQGNVRPLVPCPQCGAGFSGLCQDVEACEDRATAPK